MKKFFMIIIFLFCFLCISNVKAETYTSRVKIIKDQLPLRNDAGGSDGSKIANLDLYDYYVMVSDKLYDDVNNHLRCNGGWYNITYYSGVTGYVCEDDVEVIKSYSTDDVAPQSACEIEMSNAGFPSSYWGGLCKLKSDNPTWNFQAINTQSDWQEVVEAESSCGKNYIYYKTLDKTFFDSTCANTSPGGYVAPSQKAIAFYMDPRNFFTEKYIFQFLDQSYDESLKSIYPDAVKTIISDTAFYAYHQNNQIDSIISEITSASPLYMAVRIRQELGTKDSLYNLYSGIYEGHEKAYYGYYNFYNYGVSDSCVAQNGTTYCGLNTAKNYKWDSLSKAITDGAGIIAKHYINVGQYTGYLQKFNVTPTTGTKFSHQYQTNIAAPMSESKIAYKSYKTNNLLNLSLIFKIPVYNSMDTSITNSNNGAVESPDTPENKPSTIPIYTIVTSSGYRYSSQYISNIKPGTEVAALKSALESVGGSSTVTITDSKDNVVSSGILGTGYKVTINNQSDKETLIVVIKGDTSGDGKINALDLLQVQQKILGTYTLNGAYKEAGDTSGDGKINALDLLQVQQNILGIYNIVQ